MDGKPFNCTEVETSLMQDIPCQLHIHIGTYSRYPSVYSHKSAPGYILAVGNVGMYLSFKVNELSTFISEDAGLSWRQISKDVCLFEVGNQGGLIVLAPYARRTNSVIFSRDAGRNWQNVNFLNHSRGIYLQSLTMEGQKSSLQFIIIGKSRFVAN